MSDTAGNNDPSQNQPVQPPADSSRGLSHVVVGAEWQGPLPPPDTLALYDQILPGGADRLLTMAEKGHQHRMDQESAQLELEKAALESVNTAMANDAARGKWGLAAAVVIALLGMGIGGWLATIGKGEFGLVFLFGPLAGLVGAFVYGVRARRQSVRIQVDDRSDD